MNSYYNLFVGTENGLLKGINSQTKTFNNLNNLENLNKEHEIVSMCWTDNIKQEQICFTTRDQHLVKYLTNHEIEAPFEVMGKIEAGKGLVIGLEYISENKFVSAVDTGLIKVWTDKSEENLQKAEFELNAGSNLSCIKTSQYNTDSGAYLIASGGKENDLKIWDLNQSTDDKEPVFRAKNVPDNWMQLREPVWVMNIDFLDPSRIVVGTAYHQVRIYDIKSGIRKPVLNLNYGEHPITSIAALSDNSNRLIVGNTIGEMEMIDLRNSTAKNSVANSLKKYKSFQGTIKSMQIFDKHVATCGLDRFLRVHNIETSELMSKVYLKSRLNCLLFSKYPPVNPANSKKTKSDIDDDQLSSINSDLGTDELWSDIETIMDEHPIIAETKKRKIINKRLVDFDSETDVIQEDEKVFKKPK